MTIRRGLFRLLVLCALVLVVLNVRAVHDGLQRWGLLAAGGGIWFAGMALVPRLWMKAALGLLPVLAGTVLLLPGKPLDRERLGRDYIAALKEFEGVPYVWGGENSRGIDCSGLPRRALMKALLQQAWAGNPEAARDWADQWWHDCSAKALGQGYRHFTEPRGGGASVAMKEIGRTPLQTGDLAVTGDGRHVMVYLEKGEWIQADPQAGKVFVFRPADEKNGWREAPVTLCRWSLLGNPS